MVRQALARIPVFISLALTGAALAAQAPVAVSPGAASKVALIGDGCPTFSWGAAEGARSYELVVYRLAEEGKEAQPVLRESLAGSALSWTPSLDRCLERGSQYAWSVRAVGGDDASEWSSPSLFEVAAGPSEAEFEAAVEVVRRYLEQEDTRGTELPRETTERASERGPSTSGMPEAGVAPPPLSLGAGDSALQVNGSPVVTEATLAARCLGRRWLDQGDGTVLDCNTFLVWLKDAVCSGSKTWQTAQNWVALALNLNLLGYDCTDYTPGTYTDWRMPTVEEMCGAVPLANDEECPVANYAMTVVDNRFRTTAPSSPRVSNAAGDGRWSEGDPFVNVGGAQSTGQYWTVTPSAPTSFWAVKPSSGSIQSLFEENIRLVWPVRDGQ